VSGGSAGAEQRQVFPKPGRTSPAAPLADSAAAYDGAGHGPRGSSHLSEGLNKGSSLKHGVWQVPL